MYAIYRRPIEHFARLVAEVFQPLQEFSARQSLYERAAYTHYAAHATQVFSL